MSDEQRVVLTFGTSTDLPGRSLREWWWAYLLHGGTGFVAAFGMIVAPLATGEAVLVIPFAGLSAMVGLRQTVEFIRRGDTPGRDLGDHLTGFVFGLIAGSWAARIDLLPDLWTRIFG